MRFEARNLVVRYPGAQRPALDGISMTIPDGCLYAVLGPNGSGKSTLMRSMMGVLKPTSGGTYIDDREVGTWDRRELARAVGAVAQSETLSFPLTVREMVAMGRYPHLGPLSGESDADREAVAAALAECDVTEFVSRDVTTLSGGERQRVRIARALAQQPQALVLDEPTKSLDIRHEMAILELLRRSADSGLTVVVVTHGLDLAARFADRLLLLSQGRVAAEGTPAEVMTEPTLASVYAWPVSVTTDPVSGTPRVTPLRRGQA
ncbi:MAG: heme ABC transporter ATP-binding protein [Gemmatimonadetes bacterium]|nr:heme ABC transporter ATP-binding protein [Gemmatimonadota bacterium]